MEASRREGQERLITIQLGFPSLSRSRRRDDVCAYKSIIERCRIESHEGTVVAVQIF
jgi:hypothetical protein